MLGEVSEDKKVCKEPDIYAVGGCVCVHMGRQFKTG